MLILLPPLHELDAKVVLALTVDKIDGATSNTNDVDSREQLWGSFSGLKQPKIENT